MRVKPSHCDHYMHANNTRYADFFFDCFSMEELSARRVSSFQIVYSKQAREGKELALFREDLENCTVLELRSEGELLSQMRVVFQEGAV